MYFYTINSLDMVTINTLWDSPNRIEPCYHWRGKNRPAKRCGLRAVVPLLVTLHSSVSSSCELDGWFGGSSGVLTTLGAAANDSFSILLFFNSSVYYFLIS